MISSLNAICIHASICVFIYLVVSTGRINCFNDYIYLLTLNNYLFYIHFNLHMYIINETINLKFLSGVFVFFSFLAKLRVLKYLQCFRS